MTYVLCILFSNSLEFNSYVSGLVVNECCPNAKNILWVDDELKLRVPGDQVPTLLAFFFNSILSSNKIQ